MTEFSNQWCNFIAIIFGNGEGIEFLEIGIS